MSLSQSFRSQNTQQSFAREASGIHPTKTLNEFTTPEWKSLLSDDASAGLLLSDVLHTDDPDKAKDHMKQKPLELLKACIQATTIRANSEARQVALLFLYDAFREDSSLYMQCEDVLRQPDGHGFFRQRLEPILTQPDSISADKAAWILSSIMTNCSYHYTKEHARAVLEIIFSEGCKCTPLGKLEATCNLLKSVDFRDIAWNGCPEVQKCVLKVTASDPAPMLYKYLFALWMLSYDKDIAASLQGRGVVPVIKNILATCRVEKVIRLGLVVIKSFLPDEKLSLEIVECAILDVVQQLEFEKWRDEEIYANILEVSKLVAVQVSALSNFERYEKEVNMGHLKWGYLHSNKFWGENINKFEQNGFAVIEKLCKLLQIDDEVTQAVACYDIGEFAVLHPLGKKKVKDFEVKDRVMKLMESPNRDVKREALLCCQKIMLNKWQDASK
jgi:V-type H+-transporting ATPase subunit H